MLEFVKEILESNKNEDGSIDLEKAMKEMNAQAPKNLVPKAIFNEKLEDIKTKDTLIADLKKDNADVKDLQDKISNYEKDIETLNADRLAERKTFTLKEKLKDAGAKDIDYMIYKLGDLETDSEGNIIELDNKIKALAEENKAMFEVKEETVEEDNKGGYRVVDSKLDNGNEPDADKVLMQQVEEAMGLQQE